MGGHLTSSWCAHLIRRTARGRPDVSMRCGFRQFVTIVVSTEVRGVHGVSELGYVQLWKFTWSSDNHQQVLRKRVDCLCLNILIVRNFEVLAHVPFNVVDTSEFFALICHVS